MIACSEKQAFEVNCNLDDQRDDHDPEAIREETSTYYVDPQKGNDSSAGTSQVKAWKSLSKLSSTKLLAGDKVLLRRGSTYNETMVITGAEGTLKQPVTISAYGSGDKPKIVAPDGSKFAVQLLNCTYITVEDLDVTNHGTDAEMRDRMGVNVHLDDFGEARNTVLRNIDIHDVNGRIWKNDGAGVALRFTIDNKTVMNRFNGITVEGCTIRNSSRNGIGFQGNYTRDNWYPHKNVIIRENLIEGVPGDGIVIGECDGALVEYNLVRDCPNPWGDQHNAACGIWPWSSDNTIIQFNEVSGQKATWDGQGFDSDYNCKGTIIRYNYSHDNEGGFLLICDDGSAHATYSAGNTGTRVYGNVSYNDGTRPNKRVKDQVWFSPSIAVSGPMDDCIVYNNILYVCKRTAGITKQDKRFLNVNDWYGYPVNVKLESNVFFSEESDSSFQLSGKGGDKLDGNWYMGISTSAEESAQDTHSKGVNQAFRTILDNGSSAEQAITSAFLVKIKTATATLVTVDKDKIDKFFK